VVSKNLIRRYLDTGQRAMIAADLANMSHGGDRSKGQNCTLPIEAAAKQLKVSPRTVKTAKAIKKEAEKVKQGKTKLATAAKIVAKRSSPRPPGSGATVMRGKRAKQEEGLSPAAPSRSK
jgi:hypothetical protein